MKVLSILTKDWKRGNDIGLFLLRLVAGLALLYGHGFQKLSVILSGQEINFMDPIGIGAVPSYYLAGFAEGICAILLVAGLFSRAATSVLSVNFIVVLFFHITAGHGFDTLELVFFYLASFIALTFTGPGKISLDYWWLKRRKASYLQHDVVQLS